MSDIKTSKSLEARARAAAQKPATAGEDIDLSHFSENGEKKAYLADPSALPTGDKAKMLEVGVMLDDPTHRSGTYIQTNATPVHFSAREEGVEVMAVSEALKKYDWLPDYMWQAVAIDTDKYTANVELGEWNGYFIRALPGIRSVFPVQACLYLDRAQLTQRVHNIIIAEPGSELHIITGCVTALHEEPGLHMGVSEFYIKSGARVSFTMIHSWNAATDVRPRSGIIMEDNSLFLNNYVLMKPVKTIQMNPLTRCRGENAVARFNSILVAGEKSSMDIGSRVFLSAPRSRTEIVARTITTGGKIISRGFIEGSAPDVKGHLECRGLILGKGGVIHAIPELNGTVAGIDLSHEAAVGKINEEEVEYLMARGLTRSEATATIVRGFLKVDIEGLPPELAQEMNRAVATSEQDLM
jgi:uncharacterized protein